MKRMDGGRRFAALLATITWGALILQFGLIVGAAAGGGAGVWWGLVVYFGYFTILTNILVAVATTLPVVSPGSRPARFFQRGGPATAVAAAILLVGTAYHLLLRDVWDPQGLRLVADVVLHYVTPLMYTLYWAWTIPKDAVRWRHVPAWCAYPIGYFLYVMVRGALIGQYPYPFVDVRVLGYPATFRNALIILVGYVVLCALLVLTARRLRLRSHQAPQHAAS